MSSSKNNYVYEKGLPNFFLAGCQKTASSWLYKCFSEHPDIYVPNIDATHFFTFNYYKGFDWFIQYYNNYSGQKAVGDTTPSYIRDIDAPRRIREYYPEAKLIFSLRNPVERAFSHYWYEKAKNKITYDFAETLEIYDLYQNFIVSGFYHQLLVNYLKFFPKEQILVILYEDIKQSPDAVIENVFNFLGVDSDFKPTVLNKKVNIAAKRKAKKDNKINRYLADLDKKIRNAEDKRLWIKAGRLFIKLTHSIKMSLDTNPDNEYTRGMDPALRKRLENIFTEENEKLANLFDLDLSCWQSK